MGAGMTDDLSYNQFRRAIRGKPAKSANQNLRGLTAHWKSTAPSSPLT